MFRLLSTVSLIGLTIGLITIKLGIPSFITTLGMLFLITGLTLTISRGYPANTEGGPLLTGIMGVWAYSEIGWALVIELCGVVSSLVGEPFSP